MKRHNPLKHIVAVIQEHETYDQRTVLSQMNLTEAAFLKKAANPTFSFVQDFAQATGTTVDVRVRPQVPTGGSTTIGFEF